jgi:HSP20 family molecular chaperone IbpA
MYDLLTNKNWFLQPLTTEYLTDLLPKSDNVSTIKMLTVYPEIKDDTITAKFKLPGYEKDQIKIDLVQSTPANKTLTVKASNDEYGVISYTALIYKNIDEKLTKAVLKNGILILTFFLEKPKYSLSNLKIQVE